MMNRRFRALAAAAVHLALLLPALPGWPASGPRVLRVGDGQAYVTIQEAVDAAGPGDMVLVYPGTYVESVAVGGGGFEIVAQDPGVVVTPPGEGEACFEVKADGVAIRGFELTGTRCAPGIRFEGSLNTFSGNIIHDLTCPGVNALACRDPDGGSDYNVIEFNVLAGADLGIVVGCDDDGALNVGNLIRNNTVSEMGAVGIVVYNGTDFRILDNVVQEIPYGTGISVIAMNGLPQKNHTIAGNTVLSCAEHGIALFADGTAALSQNAILENYVDGVGEAGIYLYQDPGASLKKNRVLGNGVRGAGTAGILLEAGSKKNVVDSNFVVHSSEQGIAVAGNRNQVSDNTAVDSGLWDLADYGSGNKWRNNCYETASWEGGKGGGR